MRLPGVEKSGRYVSVSADLFGLVYPKAFISKIRCYDNGDRTYPHRDLPAANKHHPFEDEPQGVSDRDDKKNRSRKKRKRIPAHDLNLQSKIEVRPLPDCTPFEPEGPGR